MIEGALTEEERMYHKAWNHSASHTTGRRGKEGADGSSPSLILALALLAFGATTALAVNPPPQQLYFVSLPEDDLLQLFDDDDATGGTFPGPGQSHPQHHLHLHRLHRYAGVLGSVGRWRL